MKFGSNFQFPRLLHFPSTAPTLASTALLQGSFTDYHTPALGLLPQMLMDCTNYVQKTNGGSSRDHLPRPDTVIALSIKEFGIREDSSFASSLRTYFLRRGAMVDLEEAIDLNREALDLRPRRHPDRSTSLHDLTACLSERYDTLGAMVDLERAIRVARAAFKPSPTEPRAPCYNLRLLANCLRDRSRAQRSICDLDEVIELRRAAWSWHCA
ncbi:hypothetical protein BKA82DRAFT_24385 [Pisolithus tinctorius]|nr:hypothetical protein BKA82DRAFT_24385 [Pisolithus tinctorius]